MDQSLLLSPPSGIFWADELFGRSVAFIAVAMLFFEPNIVSHFSLVTTDGAVTTFVFGAVFFL